MFSILVERGGNFSDEKNQKESLLNRFGERRWETSIKGDMKYCNVCDKRGWGIL